MTRNPSASILVLHHPENTTDRKLAQATTTRTITMTIGKPWKLNMALPQYSDGADLPAT